MQNTNPQQALSRDGFTLVELLVVIGIIAVLISVLLPVLASARESANKVKCLSNMKQIGLAYLMYAQNNKGVFPCFMTYIPASKGGPMWGSSASYGPFAGSVWTSGGTVTTTTGASAYICSAQLLLLAKPYGLSGISYLKTTDCFFCPSDNARRPFVDPNTGWGPQILSAMGTGNSMSYFEWYRPRLDYSGGNNPPPNSAHHNADNFKAPTYLINDSLKAPAPAKKAIMADQGFVPNLNNGDTAQNALDYPFFHKKGWNVLYVDGHAQWVNQSYITPYQNGAPWNLNFQHAAPMAYWSAGG